MSDQDIKRAIYDCLRDESGDAGEYVDNRHLRLLAEALYKAIAEGRIAGVTMKGKT